jgi:hypothetical protein
MYASNLPIIFLLNIVHYSTLLGPHSTAQGIYISHVVKVRCVLHIIDSSMPLS